MKLGPISKRGNGYLRRLLVNGAMSVLCSKRAKEDPWLVRLLETKERKVAACALANKMARIGWAVMMRQEDFRNRRHDQPCPDLGEPGAVLTAVTTAARACGGGLSASLDRGCAQRHPGTRSGRRNGPLIKQRNSTSETQDLRG